MRDFLRAILDAKREEIRTCRTRSAVIRARCAARTDFRDLKAALGGPDIALIAEFKRRSPSRGILRDGADPVAQTRAYVRGGADAISVLTERSFFAGSLDDLERIRSAVAVPVLRKDFILDPLQIEESVAFGADGVLLIARILRRAQLAELIACARAYRMAALVEVHDAADLEKALAAGADLIGVNSRDLVTFTVDPEVFVRLRPLIPTTCRTVAESGIHTASDVARVRALGYDAVLVGEALMRDSDPAMKVRTLKSGNGGISPQAVRRVSVDVEPLRGPQSRVEESE